MGITVCKCDAGDGKGKTKKVICFASDGSSSTIEDKLTKSPIGVGDFVRLEGGDAWHASGI